MTLAQVLQLINSNVIPNNNNEITANVLRPILVEMLHQPNELIGLLSDLNTSDNSNIVAAINEIKDQVDQMNNIGIYQGVGNPNLNTSLNPNVADFYSEVDLNGDPVDLWIYNGAQWVSVNNSNNVSYNPQTPTPLEQQTARDNIDAVGNPEMQATAVPDWSTQIQLLINF